MLLVPRVRILSRADMRADFSQVTEDRDLAQRIRFEREEPGDSPRWVELLLDDYLRSGWTVDHVDWAADGLPASVMVSNPSFTTSAVGLDWWRPRNADGKVILQLG